MARVDSAKFSSKVEYRAVIRYLYLKEKPGKEIHDELPDVYGDSAPSHAQVKFWVAEFKRGRVNLEDEPRPGRPVEVTNDQTSEAVRQLVVKDRQKKVWDADNLMEIIVAGDETWVHHYDPETKEQSKQWTGFASPRPKMFKTQPSAGKVMATIFWDTKGVLLTDYLPRGQTINGEYYYDLLDRLRTAIFAK
ncbi:histone-lysine N-methyltransferase SETMAR-like [Haliotis rufescens]|uniref:histone-lysine N-methyltransferase SETMAR-like n=1 Tax=Haliotis rufescens TaxID=6454 RepID=UPI00201FA04C|nr:histone-lysine N-methyltransferase SETMAR-like [Haliotis rufescens]